jgi:hypothetical protein
MTLLFNRPAQRKRVCLLNAVLYSRPHKHSVTNIFKLPSVKEGHHHQIRILMFSLSLFPSLVCVLLVPIPSSDTRIRETAVRDGCGQGLNGVASIG